MFRPAFNVARRSTIQASRNATKRFNSSTPKESGDTKWAIGAVAVTVPALGYLLSPPEKKAHAHKAVHQAASSTGIIEEKDEDEHATEIHGPDSRASAESQGNSQTPQEHRDQAARQPTKQAKSDPSASNGDVYSKQEGLSNTETKHHLSVVHTDGENPTAKASATVDPHRERGKEKEGRVKEDAPKEDDAPKDDAPADDEAPKDDPEESD